MNNSGCERWTDSELMHWNQKKEKLKIKYPFIPDKEFEYSGEKEEIMLRVLCYKLHLTKENMLKILSRL